MKSYEFTKNYELKVYYYHRDFSSLNNGVKGIVKLEKFDAYDDPLEVIADAKEWLMTGEAKEAGANDVLAAVATKAGDNVVYSYWHKGRAEDSRDETMWKVQKRLDEMGLTCLYYGPEEDDPEEEYEFYGVYDNVDEGVSEIIRDDAEKAYRLGIFTWDKMVYPY
jgi:hypothetical protein